MGALVAPNRLATSTSKPEIKTDPTMTDLSEREREVLRLIARGATNREIANHLIISEGTVKNHVSNILSRLNLRDRTQAALYARDVGLL
jgi:DNA-binding NarL/FixJ family response regulator